MDDYYLKKPLYMQNDFYLTMGAKLSTFFCLFVLVLSILIPSASGARVFGTIYDNDLETVSAVIVEVNSTPVQRHVSKYGGYSFDLSPGSYEIAATLTLNGTSRVVAKEFVEVASREGEYIVDLFIFPDINLDSGFEETNRFDWQFFALFASAFVAVVAILVLFLFWFKKNSSSGQIISTHTSSVETPDVEYNIQYDSVEKDSSTDSEPVPIIDSIDEDSKLKKRILSLIQENSGQMTQKDIRRKIDLSEAKISQVLSDLTTEKKIKKVKKGRSNVIVLG